ncbi:MAG: SGNH/GDSL hydrolase family protein [Candidatus Omnitrophica bacterium]|nr:SGNH/GDSL hydrolase family protein [Candidatus Omnitrophota bacterium]
MAGRYPMDQRDKKLLLDISLQAGIFVALILAAEIFLRVAAGEPRGFFNFLLPADKGLYPSNAVIYNNWGKVPYVVRTNSLGFRGPEMTLKKSGGVRRIVAIGDSMTDGFFVDNEGTYPHFLKEYLDEKYPAKYDVVNAARAGGSIDKELAILKYKALPLEPDIVLLMFCTNDISDLKGKNKDGLLARGVKSNKPGDHPDNELFLALATKTAIGETLFKNLFWSGYARRNTDLDKKMGVSRYEVEGAKSYLANAVSYNTRFKNTDGMVLENVFSKEAEGLTGNYLYVLGEFNEVCARNSSKLYFVYMPAYSQIYDKKTSMRIRDILNDACKKMSISFIDLTETMRREGQDKVLFLAPLDYHLNPEGNKVIARGICEYLVKDKIS